MMRFLLAAALAAFSCPALAQAVLSTVRTAAPTAGAFSAVLTRSDTRTSCVVTNVGTTQGYCQFKPAGFTPTTANAIPVAVGAQFLCSSSGANVIVQDEVNCTCASGTCAFVVVSTGQ